MVWGKKVEKKKQNIFAEKNLGKKIFWKYFFPCFHEGVNYSANSGMLFFSILIRWANSFFFLFQRQITVEENKDKTGNQKKIMKKFLQCRTPEDPNTTLLFLIIRWAFLYTADAQSTLSDLVLYILKQSCPKEGFEGWNGQEYMLVNEIALVIY